MAAPNHYVDNKKFYEAMVIYIDKYREAKKNDEQPPQASDYIGQCIWLIATRLSTNRNFLNYTYRDEMIGDAVENCLRYLHNFDPAKTKNPFAYFTQISYYAFLRRIDKEKKQSYIRWKSMENSIVTNTLAELPNEDREFFNTVIHTMDYEKLTALSERFEKKQTQDKEKVKKKKAGPLDAIIDDSEEEKDE